MLSQALRTIVPVLDRLPTRYALIGGLALAPHNVVRATVDLDFLLEATVSQMPTLAEQLKGAGFQVTARKGFHDDPVAGVIMVETPTDTGMILCDLIFPFARWQIEAVRNAMPVMVEGTLVSVVQARDLFLLKLHAEGPQDLLDAADLLRMQSPADRIAWKKAALERRLDNEYKQCLKFLKDAE